MFQKTSVPSNQFLTAAVWKILIAADKEELWKRMPRTRRRLPVRKEKKPAGNSVRKVISDAGKEQP